MPTPSTDLIGQSKTRLVDAYKAVDALKAVLDYEPRTHGRLPALTILWRGFARAVLGQASISGQPLVDPLGGRQWVLYFTVRIWVPLKSSEQAAQYELDDVALNVVRALEVDRSLGGFADDSAMAAGDTTIVRPNQGKPMLMLTCDTAVDLTE